MSSLKLRPLCDKLWIEPIESETTTATGIVLPESAKEKPMEGKVLAAGPGARDKNGVHQPLDVKVGDRVLFAKYAGTEIKQNGTRYLIMAEKDVLAIVEK